MYTPSNRFKQKELQNAPILSFGKEFTQPPSSCVFSEVLTQFAQADSQKTQVDLLQRFEVDNLNEIDVDWSLYIRGIIVDLFLSPHTFAIRPHFIRIIESFLKATPNDSFDYIHKMFRTKLTSIIRQQQTSEFVLDESTLEVLKSVFSVTELSCGPKIMQLFVSELFGVASEAIKILTSTMTQLGSNTPLIVDEMRKGEDLLKFLLHLLQQAADELTTLLTQADLKSAPLGHHFAVLIASLCELLSFSVVDRVCYVMTGVAVAHLVRVFPCTPLATHVGYLYFGQYKPQKTFTIDDLLAHYNLPTMQHNIQDNLQGLGLLTLMRGVIFTFDPEVLVEALPSRSYSCVEVDVVTLLGLLFEFFMNQFTASADGSLRLWSVRSLNVWVSKVKSLVTTPAHRDYCVRNFFPTATNTAAPITRLIRLLQHNWEDPYEGISVEMRNVFEALMSTLVTLGPTTPSSTFNPASDLLSVGSILHTVLQMPPTAKAKYGQLLCVLPHVPAATIHTLCPTLLRSYRDGLTVKFLGSSPSMFMQKYLSGLLKQLGREQWQADVLPCVVEGLEDVSVDSQIRLVTDIFILPIILKVDGSHAVDALMTRIRSGGSEQTADLPVEKMQALMMVLKMARKLGMLPRESVAALVGAEGEGVLRQALNHASEAVRLAAVQVLCQNPKITEPVTPEELWAIRKGFPLLLKSHHESDRPSMLAALKKLNERLAKSAWKLYKSASTEGAPEDVVEKYTQYAAKVTEFLGAIFTLLRLSLYPDSAFPRVSFSLQCFSIMLEGWYPPPGSTEIYIHGPVPEEFARTFEKTVFTPEMTQALLHTLQSPWDSNRAQSSAILKLFPCPLPGLTSSEKVSRHLNSALALASSSVLRVGDAGAATVAILFSLYVLQEGWVVSADESGALSLSPPEGPAQRAEAVLLFFTALNAILNAQITLAETDLPTAARTAPMYGIALAFRYSFTLVQSKQLKTSPLKSSWEQLITSMIDSLKRMATVALTVVGHQTPEGLRIDADSEMMSGGAEDNDEGCEEEEVDDDVMIGFSRQRVSVCCWVSMREVGLLLGELGSLAVVLFADPTMAQSTGEYLLELMQVTRHVGAVERVGQGLAALCRAAFSARVSAITSLPLQWAEALMTRLCHSGDISTTRRSAGIPVAYLSILNANAAKAKSALDNMIPRLLQIANTGIADSLPARIRHTLQMRDTELTHASTSPTELAHIGVHALNILTAIFKDSHLGIQCQRYYADAFILAIDGYESGSWNVRNSATMLLSALFNRGVGNKRESDDSSAANKVTHRDFFAKFSKLYPFLLERLTAAVALQEQSASSSVNPTLYPILMLFSRFSPSVHDAADSTTGPPAAALSPAPFRPLLERACVVQNAMCRLQSARALVSLVSANLLLDYLTHLLVSIVGAAESCKARTANNAIHGYLLALQNILEYNRSFLMEKGPNMAAVASFLELVPALTPLVLRGNGCGVIRESALACLDMSYDIACLVSPGFAPELRKLLEASFDDLLSPPPKTTTEDKHPGYALCQDFLASLLLKYSGKTPEVVRSLLVSVHSEVRLSALTALGEGEGEGEGEGGESGNVALLASMLMSEANPPCRVCLLFSVSRQFNLTLPFFTPEMWARVLSILETSPHTDLLGGALCLAGRAVGASQCSAVSSALFLRHLQKFAAPIYPYSLRLDAARALDYSNILQQSDSLPAAEALSAWLVLFTLLQDDDVEIRQHAAALALRALGRGEHSLCVPLVYEAVLTHVAGVFATAPEVHRMLIDTLRRPALEFARDTPTEGGETAVFAKDMANLCEEQAFSFQLSARLIAALRGDIRLQTPRMKQSSSSALFFTAEELEAYGKELETTVELFVGAVRAAGCGETVTHTPAGFNSVYGLLLLSKALHKDCGELQQILSSSTTHPILSSLLMLPTETAFENSVSSFLTSYYY